MNTKKDRRRKRDGAKAINHPRKGPHRISVATMDAEATFPLSEWMVPATDAHGHSAKVFCRCPPGYKHQINRILQAGKFPWETESDLVRWAVHHALDAIAEKMKGPDAKEITNQQAILNSLVEMASRQMFYAHFKDALEKLEQTTSYLISQNAKPMARKVIHAVENQLAHFDEPFWQERYREVLVRRFAEFLK